MRKKYIIAFFILLFLAVVLLAILFLRDNNIAVLNPKGTIGLIQRDLIATTTWLMLIVVIPVFILTVVIAWKYRASNTKAKYAPDWDHNLAYETVWWGLPLAIVFVLSVIAWDSSYELDPYKPLDSEIKPITIQVVALDWKWLFIYPEQNIATVNFIQFPEKTPINFEITADAPMNSFWIPQLGGQIFAMPGMKTKLHLIANEIGDFRGSSANLSGEGFSGMSFTAKASSQADFDAWIKAAQQTPNHLDLNEYHQLVEPSAYNPVTTYLLEEKNLYEQIIMKYMMPMSKTPEKVSCLEN